MEEIQRKVNGMTCEMCVRHVREALEDLEGVEEARVDLQNKTAVITYDASRVDPEAMERAVKEAGYELT